MPRRSGSSLSETACNKGRFDAESARRILQRAAAEQQRLNNELADSYSFEELEEMAAEAGISSEALRAAVEAPRNSETAEGTPVAARARPRRGLSARQRLKPGNWSDAVKGVVLIAGSIGFLGSLLAFPAFADAVLWVLLLFVIVLSVLIVLGASPF